MKLIIMTLMLHFSTGVIAEKDCDSLHSVIYRYAVNHKNKLTHFNIYPPVDCNRKDTSIELTKAWLKTACAYFVSTKPKKTYGRWSKAKFYYGFYSFDTNYPEIILLPFDKNKPADAPEHVVVLPSIMNKHTKEHVCDGDLIIPFDEKNKK